MICPRTNIFVREKRLEHRVNHLLEYANECPTFEFEYMMNKITQIMEELIQINLITTGNHDFIFLDAIEFKNENNNLR